MLEAKEAPQMSQHKRYAMEVLVVLEKSSSESSDADILEISDQGGLVRMRKPRRVN